MFVVKKYDAVRNIIENMKKLPYHNRIGSLAYGMGSNIIYKEYEIYL